MKKAKSSFQLVNQRITDVIFKINKNFPKQEILDINIPIDFKVDVKKLTDTTALVVFTTKIFKELDKNNYPFYIEITTEGKFKWSDGLENVDRFLNINAPAILMSYIRSMITQLTVFSGFPPLILPLINFTKDKENK